MSERDIVERLRGDGFGSQNCPLCWQSGFVLDSVKFTRCGRGDCAQEEAAREEAAAEILRLRSELADARRAGWIAGRDAAADVARKLCLKYQKGFQDSYSKAKAGAFQGAGEIVSRIEAMEPPA